MGEVEAVFGIWLIPLFLAIILIKGWPTLVAYITDLSPAEPVFVVVIMAMASSRPVLRFAENFLAKAAALGHSTVSAWWLSILTIGPLLGSFITEPAAMTICALLLKQKFYALKPSKKLGYATLGLLFVNISVGGALSHFAAPPVVMVATKWDWDFHFMLTTFGWESSAWDHHCEPYLLRVVPERNLRPQAEAHRRNGEADTNPVPDYYRTPALSCLDSFYVALSCVGYPGLFIFPGIHGSDQPAPEHNAIARAAAGRVFSCIPRDPWRV